MKYVPHDYQSYATDFILKNPVAAILLQMGLGKSVITLTAIRELLDRGEVKKVLVVAPLRVARDTWPEEIRKWDHLKGLSFSVAVGTADERRAAIMAGSEVTIINRENVPWLVEASVLQHGECLPCHSRPTLQGSAEARLGNGDRRWGKIPFDYDMVVIDELSSFKNWQAKRFRSLMKVRPLVRRIVGLTGTPSPNGYMDLFAEYRLLDMGERLGRFIGRYREAYFTPDRWGNGQVFSWKLRPGADEAIYRKIQDITVSMKSVDHLKMPECVMNTLPVHMDERERTQYETLKEELFLRIVSKDGIQEVDAKNASVLCGKLSQLANGAVYSEDGTVARIHDRKLDALEDLIESAGGNPLLVAYWFQHDLWRMKERFPELRVLKSPEDIRDWNAGKIQVAAIHPASCGHGLNLQAGGSTLVWFGLTWSLELYQQTNARLWRQGQRAETVVIHHLVTEGTVDGRILTALKNKDRSQESLISAVKAQINQQRNGAEGPGRPEGPGRTRRCEIPDEGWGDGRKVSRGGAA